MFTIYFVVAVLLLVVAIYFLPWQSWLIILPAGVLTLWLARGRIFLYLFSIPFRMKGKVLRNAAIDVHSVRPVSKPEPPAAQQREELTREHTEHEEPGAEPAEEPDDLPEKPIVWPLYYEIEVTITPRSPTGSFRLWAPHDLQLISPRANPMDDGGDVCQVLNVKVHPPDNLSPDESVQFEEGSKFFGPLRLTLLVGVASGVRKLAFNYYFRKFGMVELPPATAPNE